MAPVLIAKVAWKTFPIILIKHTITAFWRACGACAAWLPRQRSLGRGNQKRFGMLFFPF